MNWKLLEPVTMLVLVAVAGALGWIIAASYAPEAVRWASQEIEVMVILVLFTVALILVSVVALRHTRSRDLP